MDRPARLVTLVYSIILIAGLFLGTENSFCGTHSRVPSYVPERLRIALRINELTGQKPSTVQEYFDGLAAYRAQARERVSTPTATDTTTFTKSGIALPGAIDGQSRFIDFDSDGYLDAVISGRNESTFVTKIFRNNGSGGFEDTHALLPQLQTQRNVAWGDYNNDASLDLFIAGAAGEFDLNDSARLYHNVGGVWEDAFPDLNLRAVAGGTAIWFDYDNDGLSDLFYQGSPDYGSHFYTMLYRNNGNGFDPVETGIPGVWATGAAVGDYNNDGNLDIILTGWLGGPMAAIYKNVVTAIPVVDSLGDTTYTYHHEFVDIGASLMPVNSGACAWSDVDNDGLPDAIVVGVASGNIPTAKIYKNMGGDTFQEIPAGLKGVANGALAVGDYDNDGYPDLAISGSQSYYVHQDISTTIYHNDFFEVNLHHDSVTAPFHDIGAKLDGAWYGDLSWGDYDNDGRLDLMVSGETEFAESVYGSGTTIYHNNLTSSGPPPSVPHLNMPAVRSGMVNLSWQKSTDAHTPQTDLTYNIRIGSTPGGSDIFQPMAVRASGKRRFVTGGNASSHRALGLPSLKPGRYYWSVQAVNNAYAASPFADEQYFDVVDRHAPKHPWHLVSVPLDYESALRTDIYPTAVSSAFAYSGSYVACDSMHHGRGYWLRIGDDSAYTVVSSVPRLAFDNIHLEQSWNLIGSIGSPVSVGALVAANPSLLSPFVYTYTPGKGYETASEILPFHGYWVKALTDGDLELNGALASTAHGTGVPSILDRCNTVVITDATGATQTLRFTDDGSLRAYTSYTNPPPAPDDIFEARFSSGSLLEVADGRQHNAHINLKSAAYPVRIEWRVVSPSNAKLEAAGKSIALDHDGQISVASAADISLRFQGEAKVPTAFTLHQNYPNPFNPRTTIDYDLPSDSHVRLTIVNTLGQVICELVDGVETAGFKTIGWDASAAPSGMYFVRLDAQSVAEPAQHHVQVSKMALVK